MSLSQALNQFAQNLGRYLPLMSRTVKKTPEAFLGEGERQ